MTDLEQKEIFAHNLNRLLSKYGKSQREVAEAIDVSPQTFNTWCQAIALPRMGKVQRLADYFHIPKSHLIDDISNNEDVSSPDLYSLSAEDQSLLDDFQKLNASGRQKAREYITDLTEQKKYTEDTESSASAAG